MKPTKSRVHVSDRTGYVSTLTLQPDRPKAFISLAHGAGAGMTHSFMERLAQKLLAHDIGTVRFNFPYIENKKKVPDVPAVAEKTVATVLADVEQKFSSVPVFLGGKSFGGRMSSQFVSQNEVKARGIIFYGFPLHAPGKVDASRGEHLKKVKVPMLFLQGTRDALANLPLMEQLCNELKLATLVKFEGADHSFKIKGKEAIDDLASETTKWIEQILKK